MQLKTAAAVGALSIILVCLGASGQVAAPDPDTHPRPAKTMPPRAAPTDYQAHAQAGPITIAAEFDANSVPAPEAVYSNEDYITVEAAVYGPPGARLKLSLEDFGIRLNGKKSASPAKPYEMLFKALKDPEWVPPVDEDSKSKGSGGLGSGGDKEIGDSIKPVVHMPPAMQRAMELNVQNASFPEGDRMLPQAGLLYFSYAGNANKLRSIELDYTGPAGKASLTLK